jgi:very-short-patch-repair endonuclease
MGNDGATETLRAIVERAACAIAGGSTHPRLDNDLMAAGLPPSSGGETKAQRGESSAAPVPDERLREVAVGLVERNIGIQMADQMAVQDLVWSDGHPPAIPKRTRRDIACALPGEILGDHAQRLHSLLATLFDLGSRDLFFGLEDTSLGGQIDRHFFRNDDWTVEQLFDELGAIDRASDRRFGLFLESIVSSSTVPNEDSQRRLVEAINPPLIGIGLELRETENIDGYPVFLLVVVGARSSRPKQLIFGSPDKPDLRLIDVIDSDVQMVDPTGKILFYDRPIGSAGLRWCDLQAWWKETRRLENDDQAKVELYQRLGHSLFHLVDEVWVPISPPQLRLFKLYHDIYSAALPGLPALLPEVWRHWDPVNAKTRGKDALVQFRMDFLMFGPSGARIVLEVDGQHHYASERRVGDGKRMLPDGKEYARTMAASRDLTLAGYEVHRFGAQELQDEDEARQLITAFFNSLFRKHRIVVPNRSI